MLDYHNFGNGTMILVFDLTVRGECNSEQFTVKKLGNLRISLKYKNALTETNNLILYGEFDHMDNFRFIPLVAHTGNKRKVS